MHDGLEPSTYAEAPGTATRASTEMSPQTATLAASIADNDMSGRVCVVTGASRGLGKATALGLARLGATVVLLARDERLLSAARDEVAAESGNPHVSTIVADLASFADIRTGAQELSARHEAIHVLVHNAGVLHRGRIDEVTPADLDDTIAVNVAAPLFLTQALLPQLRAAGGARIVVVSSRAGALREGMSGGNMAYRISKAAVNAFTNNLAAELAGDGILVNAMHPGWVRTDMGGPSASVSPEDGARTAIFLATLPDGGPSGRFWQEEREIDW